MHTYATTYELKKQRICSKQRECETKIAVLVTFILEKKVLQQIFYQNLAIFSVNYMFNLNSCQDEKFESVCHDLKTEKEEIYAKRQECEKSNWDSSDLHVGN